jgi:hypothetical protein
VLHLSRAQLIANTKTYARQVRSHFQ